VRCNDGLVVTTLLKASARKPFLVGCQRLITWYIRNFTIISEYCFLEPPLRHRNFNMHLQVKKSQRSCLHANFVFLSFLRMVSSTNLGADDAHTVWSISSPLPQTRCDQHQYAMVCSNLENHYFISAKRIRRSQQDVGDS
jgi:hypothetical protein